jgi:hypothetical protein
MQNQRYSAYIYVVECPQREYPNLIRAVLKYRNVSYNMAGK